MKQSTVEDSMKLKNAKQAVLNTIKIFGAVNLRGVAHLRSTCKKHGIPLQTLNVRDIQRRGYKSQQFDSRHYIVLLGNTQDTVTLHRSLQNAEKHVPPMSHWRHTVKHTSLEATNNPFTPLESLSPEKVEDLQTQDDMRVCCWNINTLNGKEKLVHEYAKKNCIHILGLGETKRQDRSYGLASRDFTWFGRAATKKAGGVGFLVDTSVLADAKIETADGKTPDTLFLRITPENSRTTLFMLVYGITAPSKLISKAQWDGYRQDLRRELKSSPADTDVIFLGDINARMGKAQNPNELEHISAKGESTRSVSGTDALAFLEEMNLVCLNDRDHDQQTPNYTYREHGKLGQSVIDVICVSRGMYRPHYHANVVQETLTTRENHFPITATIAWHRRRSHSRKTPRWYAWNTRVLEQSDKREEFEAKIETLIDRSRCTAELFTQALRASAKMCIGRVRVGDNTQCSRKQKQLSRKKDQLRAFRENNKDNLAKKSAPHLQEEEKLVKQIQKISMAAKTQSRGRLARRLHRQYKNNDMHSVFRTVAELQEKPTSKTAPIACIQDKQHRCRTSTKLIHQALRAYWSEFFQNDQFEEEMKNINVNDLANKPHSPLCDTPITLKELTEVLTSLEKRKAQGLDEIPPTFLKIASEKIKAALLKVFNEVLSTGQFPKAWKTDRRTP
ncbi:MAG: hypothetical protein AMXMBFR44_6790, partial [Candidatus Campbellbacteria bacterium]